MKLPFVSRLAFEAQEVTIALQKRMLADRDGQIADLKALFNKTSAFEVVGQEDNKVTLKLKSQEPIASGRGAWRSQRTAQEAQTVPVPADSQQALEQRVKEQRKTLQEN